MEVETISCNKKITAKLAINVNTIEYKTSSVHGDEEVFELPFTISVGDGSNYHGKIVLFEKVRPDGRLLCYVYDVKSLTGNISMMVSNFKTKTHLNPGDSVVIPNAKYLVSVKSVKNIAFLKGSYTITFEPMDEKLLEEKLINSFSLLKQDQLEVPNDVTLVVQGKEFEFNMSFLAKISPMFKDLFENCSSLDRKIPITDGMTTLQTMVTFQKILLQKTVEPQDITMDLYKFADKYNIQPLVKFCGDPLGLKINNENVLEIALAADMANDEALLKKAATFLMANTDGNDLKNFLKNNPGFGDRLVARLFLATMK